MTDFVLEQKETIGNLFIGHNAFEFCRAVNAYANFLKQPLKLEMFVPCDDDGNVLEEPIDCQCSCDSEEDYCICKLKEEYQEAKKKVLFDYQFTYDTKGSPSIWFHDRFHIINCLTIESIVKYDLTLTETAMNMIYGTDI